MKPSSLWRRAALRRSFHSASFAPTMLGAGALVACLSLPAQAQNFRFILRAEPDVIAANGISTTSIFVQLPQNRDAITAAQTVRFATTAGTIEGQAQLNGGVARVLLRSSNTPGTAIVTAFIGSSREAITVEFSEENGLAQRTLEIAAPYIAYGADASQITASGPTSLDFGDTHIESDVRLDVDLGAERVWAQGSQGRVIIRQGRGAKAKELRGDRLFYDLRRKSGVLRRSEAQPNLPARQEFIGNDFAEPPEPSSDTSNTITLQNPPDTAAANSPAGSTVASPSKPLETPGNRGSIFVAPNAPPLTGAPSEKSDRPDALTPPLLLPNAPKPEAQPALPDSEKPTPSEPVGTQGGAITPAEVGVGASPAAPIEVPAAGAAITPGSLSGVLGALVDEKSRGESLAGLPPTSQKGDPVSGSPEAPGLPEAPDYAPLNQPEGPTPRIVELPPPVIDAASGYWVAARRVRVFPRDKVQFERAAIFFNGAKAFGAPLYVLPLDGSFNPTTDTISFNSQGGIGLKFPFYYQATKGGTGAIYLKREQTGGFSANGGGFSLALDQQYWLSPDSHGRFSIDRIGQGSFDLNYQHQLQISPTTSGALYLSAPRHRDLFARASLATSISSLQLGFEGFFDKPQGTDSNLRGQFFARSRPREIGKSGWNYTLSANALAVQRNPRALINNSTSGGVTGGTTGGGLGGGIGGPRGGGGDTDVQTTLSNRPLLGQTFGTSLQSPFYSPWRGSGLTANLLATGFNYSDGRRGFAPGANLSFSQKLGRLDARFDYTYDKSNVGLYAVGSDSFTNYFSGTVGVQFSSNLALSSFLSRSLNDSSTYGSADLSYFFAPKWRAGLFTDYSSFSRAKSLLNYGGSLGRAFGSREISINYDAQRGRIYFELGNGRY